MIVRTLRMLKRAALLLAVILITLLAIRVYDTQRGRPLGTWHTYVPHELSIKELDHAGWAEYLEAQNALAASVEFAFRSEKCIHTCIQMTTVI